MSHENQTKDELIQELHRLQEENNVLNLANAKFHKGQFSKVNSENEIPETKEIDLKFKNMVDAMQVGVMLQNVHSEILLCNPKALELLGISEDQLLGKTSFDPDWNVIHEDGSPFPGHTHPVPQAIMTLQSVHNVVMGVFRPINNDRIWLRVDAELQLNSDETVRQVVCSFVDITKRKHAEDQLLIANNEISKREIEIQKSYAILNSIFESSENVIIFSLDINYCYMAFTNVHKQTMKQIWGVDIEIGMNMLNIISIPIDRNKAKYNFDQVLKGEHLRFEEEYGDSKLLRTYYENIYNPIIDSKGVIIGLSVFVIDITDRKNTEKALINSEEKFRSLYANMNEGSALHTLEYNNDGKPVDYRIIEVNSAFETLLGISRKDVVNKTSKQAYNTDEPPYLDVYSKVVLTGKPEVFETYFAPLNKHFSISVYSPNAGSFATIFENITERKKSENNLAKSQELLKKFARHLQDNQEEERVIIATQLDNELGQILVRLKMDIGLMKQNILKESSNNESINLFKKLDDAHNTIGNSIKTTLKLMNELRYEVLYLMGFVEAVKLYSTDFQEQNKIKCIFESAIEKLKIDGKQVISLFRIFEIAMSNVAEHSKATEVKISLSTNTKKIRLEIADNGIGFSQKQQANPSSNGLIFMKERTFLMNGTLLIESIKKQGTKITVEIPETN